MDVTSPPASHHADPDLNFRDSSSHDATVVRGPQGFATKTVLNKNQRFRFTVPGEYKLYCSIHPVLMAQVVKVR